MTVVRLQRHAPEAQNAIKCAICGMTESPKVTDHIQIGTPGAPAHDEGVCESCGAVLGNVVDKFGGDLTMLVTDAQREAGEKDVTVHATQPHKPDPA